MNFEIHFLLSLFLLFFYVADAFNITQLLGQYPDYSTFNNYLTQAQLAGQINSRQTITVLAVNNANISPLSGKSADVLKSIMSVHVVLDYYDVKKLQKLPNKTAILTTLFQSSGKANGQQGFLNVTDLSTGGVVFGSAAKGATLGANLVESIASQPYNISVLHVSTVIIPLGIDNATAQSPPPPSPSPGPAAARPPRSPTPARSPTPSKSPSASPTSPPPADADTPSAAPGSPPAPSDAPGSPPAPSAAPGSPPVPNAPTAETPAADAPADNTASLGSSFRLSFGAMAMIVLSTVCFV